MPYNRPRRNVRSCGLSSCERRSVHAQKKGCHVGSWMTRLRRGGDSLHGPQWCRVECGSRGEANG